MLCRPSASSSCVSSRGCSLRLPLLLPLLLLLLPVLLLLLRQRSCMVFYAPVPAPPPRLRRRRSLQSLPVPARSLAPFAADAARRLVTGMRNGGNARLNEKLSSLFRLLAHCTTASMTSISSAVAYVLPPTTQLISPPQKTHLLLGLLSLVLFQELAQDLQGLGLPQRFALGHHNFHVVHGAGRAMT